MPEPLSFEEAAALVDQVRAGRRDLQSIPGYPMLVVGLDGQAPGDASALAPSTGWPIVVVGVGAASARPPAGPGPDLFLTRTSDPPAPWVSTGHPLDRALADLHEAVSAHPQASATLVQVLRSTENAAVDSALVIESLAYAALQGGAEHRKWLEGLSRPPLDEDPSPTVLLERDGSALRIALNRAARRNAYSSRMRDELIQALELAAADDSIALVEVRGIGPNFCSGGDLAEFGSVEDTATAHWIRMQRSAGRWMHLLSHRSVVHVHGACVGAGVELPAFAGTIVARSDATFALPEVKMGLIPGAGGTASIPRRIGRQRAAWLALSGHRLAAKEALGWGLVDRLSDSAD